MTMIFEQIYLGCLAQASYLIGSRGVAAVVDPRRDVDEYVAVAEERGLKITHVFLSHIHADFVAGHVELAARTGATIHVSQRADCKFECVALRDGDRCEIGDVTIEVLETPGHTPSDVCLLVRDSTQPDAPGKLLTGDALFIGDVGRPDLAGGAGFEARDMAGMMYDSLHEKILPLPDDIEIYPGHGAGSACGRSMSDERSSTLGQQRLANWALQPQDRARFVEEQVSGLQPAPRYFARAARTNMAGPTLLRDVPPLAQLDRTAVSRDVQVLDTRFAAQFGKGHLPGSINIGLSGQFESWAGTLLDPEVPIILVGDAADAATEARTRLARVGLENVAGYHLFARDAESDQLLPQITVQELNSNLAAGGWQVVDVRRPTEYEAGHAPGAVLAPLHLLPTDHEALGNLDRSTPTAIICGSGYRSSAAAHYLRSLGFENLHNVTGGTNAWKDAGLTVEH